MMLVRGVVVALAKPFLGLELTGVVANRVGTRGWSSGPNPSPYNPMKQNVEGSSQQGSPDDVGSKRIFEWTPETLNKRGLLTNQKEIRDPVVDTWSKKRGGGAQPEGKKRSKRRPTAQLDDDSTDGTDPSKKPDMKNTFPVLAYATCEELNLEKLHEGLIQQDLYIPTVLSEDMEDVIHVAAKYQISAESREIFFFREGAVIFWNMPELECLNVLKFLKTYEHESYDVEQVTQELEYMRYYYHDQGNSRLSQGKIVLNVESGNKILDKYAFANAMASSVKLGIWESTLEKFVDSIAHITEELKRAEKVHISREKVLQKTGELFSLRHELNLNSDLLDTPDFYWERERLESIYLKTCNYLNLHRRTKVLNEKMTQCSELLELISTHLTDNHHTRLEWMIIALITIEVGFEILHVVERYAF